MTAYPFLSKATKPEIMTMKEIAAFENTDNPKEAIRKLVEDAKQRRKALRIDDFEHKTVPKAPVKVKTSKTLKLGKTDSEITIKAVKSNPVKKRSASSKKAAATKTAGTPKSSARSRKSLSVAAIKKSVASSRKASAAKVSAAKASVKKPSGTSTAKKVVKTEPSPSPQKTKPKSQSAKAAAAQKENTKPPTPKKISAQGTPEKKRQTKLRVKEEQ